MTQVYENRLLALNRKKGAHEIVQTVRTRLRKALDAVRAPRMGWVGNAALAGLAEAVDDISYTY